MPKSIEIDTNGLRWFDDSPDAGDPACICSHCDQLIAGEIPLRLYNSRTGQEARLHQACFAIRTGAPVAAEFVPAPDGEIDEGVDLGPCCACEASGPSVRTIICLPKRAPIPGTGWGCVVCGLPSDGAIAVVCDGCLESNAPIGQVCVGYPAEGTRIRWAALHEPFEHIRARHPEMEDEQ